ncbi:DUF4402 domain-containing protein [Bowmanella sp. Y26]|uniref:DUF4402 domain-containing protein n=1 Tax=Bowmanella yangjiangensis TaxID=2811230 RepID=UPI001BDD3E4B|nr:DUF4402 domain-containing protein [Bowmanella yangjiangensis]MBT1065217.1 DUF4402 domain-containing protein [Bowmanella yangjiangensis]
MFRWVGLASCLICTLANADLLIDTPFTFGRLAISDNSQVSSTTLARNGNQSYTGRLLVIEKGTPGTYTLTELPPFTSFSLTPSLPAYSSVAIPGSAQFVITALDIPPTVKADINGDAQFTIGGTLTTSGNGQPYLGPADYQIMLDIEISY